MKNKVILAIIIVGIVCETCVLFGLLAFNRWKAHGVSAVQRGYAVAEHNGCFGCHGPGGVAGIPNPGSKEQAVPSWNGGTLMMYAKDEQEIREWILDGMPKRHKGKMEEEKDRPLLQMPAFRGKVTGRDLGDLVAYFKAVAWADMPDDPNAEQGQQVASGKGCFGCHGPEGRGTISNPGSFKGYVPSWDGPDFPDLVRDDNELQQWIMNGVSNRFEKNPAAEAFLKHAPIKMPAFRNRISKKEYEQIKAYIHWLQKESPK